MGTTGYNGYTNYETWLTHLWIANDSSEWEHWKNVARECFGAALGDDGQHPDEAMRDARWDLAERLRDSFEDGNPLVGQLPSVYTDLMAAALDEVNWREIADCLLDDLTIDDLPGPAGDLPCDS